MASSEPVANDVGNPKSSSTGAAVPHSNSSSSQPSKRPVSELSIQESLALLPKEVADLVSELPEDKARQVLKQLLQLNTLDIRPLTKKDVKTIRARTESGSQYGFLPVDVDITWEELCAPSYISLGAFEQRDGQDLPVAFLVAQLASIRQVQADPNIAPRIFPVEQLESFVKESGGSTKDLSVGIYFVGVDYEYRRQGIASTLMDTVKEIAMEAGARLLWLSVADYNEAGLALYHAYGFQRTNYAKEGKLGRQLLMVCPVQTEGSTRDMTTDSHISKGSGEQLGGSRKQQRQGFGSGTTGFGKSAGGVQGIKRGKRKPRAVAVRALPQAQSLSLMSPSCSAALPRSYGQQEPVFAAALNAARLLSDLYCNLGSCNSPHSASCELQMDAVTEPLTMLTRPPSKQGCCRLACQPLLFVDADTSCHSISEPCLNTSLDDLPHKPCRHSVPDRCHSIAKVKTTVSPVGILKSSLHIDGHFRQQHWVRGVCPAACKPVACGKQPAAIRTVPGGRSLRCNPKAVYHTLAAV